MHLQSPDIDAFAPKGLAASRTIHEKWQLRIMYPTLHYSNETIDIDHAIIRGVGRHDNVMPNPRSTNIYISHVATIDLLNDLPLWPALAFGQRSRHHAPQAICKQASSHTITFLSPMVGFPYTDESQSLLRDSAAMFGLHLIIEGLYRLEVCIGIGKREKAWLEGSCHELIVVFRDKVFYVVADRHLRPCSRHT